MTTFTNLGPATITLAGDDFSGEFLNFTIGHEYEDVGEDRTMLDGTERLSGDRRADSVSGDVENDLTGVGLYAYLYANDGQIVDFEAVLNTGEGATWAGQVKLRLPSEIGADEFGAPIASSVEWNVVGPLTFTAAP